MAWHAVRMAESTTSRVLQLLSVLQTRRSWSGPELAERIGVSQRTIRRDVDRLRELGYRIEAERGSVGGYRLEAGSSIPPLLFSSEEAVALALGMRAAATDGALQGAADVAVSVLAKLEQVLPSAVRLRVRAVQAAVSAPGPVHSAEPIDPETFAMLALACRDSEVVRFGYSAADGSRSPRRAEPIALVPLRRRWYLLAWDTDRDDWRTFRLDRVAAPLRTRLVVPRRAVPSVSAGAFVQERLRAPSAPRLAATVRIAAPLAEVEAYLGGYTTGLTADGGGTLWRISDERLEVLAGALTWLIWPFEIVEGEALQAFVGAFVGRLRPADAG